MYDRNAGLDRVFDRAAERVRVGQRDHQAVGRGRCRGFDQVGHIGHIAARGKVVFELGADRFGGVFTAFLHHRPERVGALGVGNHHVALGQRAAGERQRGKTGRSQQQATPGGFGYL